MKSTSCFCVPRGVEARAGATGDESGVGARPVTAVVPCLSTGDRVAKSRAGGWKPCRAALSSLLLCGVRAPGFRSARLPLADEVLIGPLRLPGDQQLLIAQRLDVIGVGWTALVTLLHRSAGLQLERTIFMGDQCRARPVIVLPPLVRRRQQRTVSLRATATAAI